MAGLDANHDDQQKQDWLVQDELERAMTEMKLMADIYERHGLRNKADELRSIIDDLDDSANAA